jgi:GxxExxY protein
MNDVDAISADVVDEAIRIHRGYKIDRQKPVDIRFDGMTFAAAFRVDIQIDDSLIIEIKSVERLNGAHAKQLLTYLRLLRQPLGLLLNFSGETMKEGIRRLVNNHRPIR